MVFLLTWHDEYGKLCDFCDLVIRFVDICRSEKIAYQRDEECGFRSQIPPPQKERKSGL